MFQLAFLFQTHQRVMRLVFSDSDQLRVEQLAQLGVEVGHGLSHDVIVGV